MKFRLMMTATALATSLFLSACGGGGDGGSSTLSGTAAAGLPLVGSVTVKDANGTTRTVGIGSNGAYTVDVTGLTGPFLLRATGTAGGSTYVVHSAATAADLNGNINITPLTDLILSNVAGQIAASYFDSGSFGSLSATQLSTEAAKLKEKLLPVLQAMGVDASTDLLRARFTPLNSALDKALDAINVSYDTNTNIATLTNVLTSESITDNITTPAAQETSPPTMSNTANLDTAASDITPIRTALSSFSAEFATALPTVNALKGHFTSGFKTRDVGPDDFASELSGNGNNVGLQFTDVTINSIDYATDPSQPTADVTLLVKNGSGVILDKMQHFKLKKVNGTWKLHGDQHVLDASADVHITRTTYQMGNGDPITCTGTGLEFWIEDLDDSDSIDINHIVVTGPGLPQNGVRYARPSQGGPWLLSGINQSDTWYQLANTCESIPTAGLSNDQIAAIPDNATYTLTMYDEDDQVLTALGRNGTYRYSTAGRPMTLAELANSSALPSITSPASVAAFVSDNSDSITVSASHINPAYGAWVYVGRTHDLGGLQSAEADLIAGSSGNISRSFSLSTPQSGSTLLGKEIRVETHDAGLRDIMTQYFYAAPVNSTD